MRQRSFSSTSNTHNTEEQEGSFQDQALSLEEPVSVHLTDSVSQVVNTNDHTSENDEVVEQASSDKVSQSAYDAQNVYFQGEFERLTQLLLKVVALAAPTSTNNDVQEPVVHNNTTEDIPSVINTVVSKVLRYVDTSHANTDNVPTVPRNISTSNTNNDQEKNNARGKPKDDAPSNKGSSSSSSSNSSSSSTTSSSSTDDSSSTSSTTTCKNESNSCAHGTKLQVSKSKDKFAKKIANLSSRVITLLS